MSKRGLLETAPDSPTKRTRLDKSSGFPANPNPSLEAKAIPSQAWDFTASEDCPEAALDNCFSNPQTPLSAAETEVTSPLPAATTQRPRFPSDLKTLQCTWPGCLKTFNRPARLRDHLNSHTNSRPFRCTYAGCNKDYIEHKHLKQHVKAVHILDRHFVCQTPGCGKSFVTGTRLRRHQAVHEGADRFRCERCGQSFRKRETLHRHVRMDHLNKPAFECTESGCAEAFDSKPTLKRHWQRVHGEPRFWCLECALAKGNNGVNTKLGFTTDALLQAHVKREHQNCIFCDFHATSHYELEQHVELHHSGKSVQERKKHACPQSGCKKRFTTKSNLNTHIRSAHHGLRFVCGEFDVALPDTLWFKTQGCGDTFSTKARLEDHIRFLHLGHQRPRLSKPPQPELDVLDELSGPGPAYRPEQNSTSLHGSAMLPHPPEDPPSLISDYHHLAPYTATAEQTDMFGCDQDAVPLSWPNDDVHEGLFAAQMNYPTQRHDWLEGEADLLRLEHASPAKGDASVINPALTGLLSF